jgi:hypothetical protein
MPDVQGAQGSILIREAAQIGGKSPNLTRNFTLDVSPAVESVLAASLVGDNVRITGFYVEGDASDDFEVSIKDEGHGDEVWLTVPMTARSFSLAGLWTPNVYFRSTGTAMPIKVYATLAIEPGVPVP